VLVDVELVLDDIVVDEGAGAEVVIELCDDMEDV
jgi:hypothetical protein